MRTRKKVVMMTRIMSGMTIVSHGRRYKVQALSGSAYRLRPIKKRR